MRIRFLSAAAFLLIAMLAGRVHAAETATDDDNGGPQTFAGLTIECRDIRGRAVRTFRVLNLGDVGRAGIVNRVPIIAIDPHIMASLPERMQLFFYLHECAHHVLGHWLSFSTSHEQEADCWAIRYARDRGVLLRKDVEGFGPVLAGSKGSEAGHLPGPERERHLLSCYDDPPREVAAH